MVISLGITIFGILILGRKGGSAILVGGGGKEREGGIVSGVTRLVGMGVQSGLYLKSEKVGLLFLPTLETSKKIEAPLSDGYTDALAKLESKENRLRNITIIVSIPYISLCVVYLFTIFSDIFPWMATAFLCAYIMHIYFTAMTSCMFEYCSEVKALFDTYTLFNEHAFDLETFEQCRINPTMWTHFWYGRPKERDVPSRETVQEEWTLGTEAMAASFSRFMHDGVYDHPLQTWLLPHWLGGVRCSVIRPRKGSPIIYIR